VNNIKTDIRKIWLDNEGSKSRVVVTMQILAASAGVISVLFVGYFPQLLHSNHDWKVTN
jgi:hypothetical protein